MDEEGLEGKTQIMKYNKHCRCIAGQVEKTGEEGMVEDIEIDLSEARHEIVFAVLLQDTRQRQRNE